MLVVIGWLVDFGGILAVYLLPICCRLWKPLNVILYAVPFEMELKIMFFHSFAPMEIYVSAGAIYANAVIEHPTV